jgi:hypothetical protein
VTWCGWRPRTCKKTKPAWRKDESDSVAGKKWYPHLVAWQNLESSHNLDLDRKKHESVLRLNQALHSSRAPWLAILNAISYLELNRRKLAQTYIPVSHFDGDNSCVRF